MTEKPRSFAVTTPASSLDDDAFSRAFRLTVQRTPGKDTYGITLEETYGHNGSTLAQTVTSVTAAQAARVLDTILASVKASGHSPTVLGPSRRTPIPLNEPSGVRLALQLAATAPIIKTDRVRAIVNGINTMSVEETYYWYAKTMGADSTRARRALRLLLADD